jgi:hypothetical protein
MNKNKGGLMFEFALLLPLIVGLIGFTIDMGRYINLATTLQDSTSVAARAGARIGYAGDSNSYQECPVINNNDSQYYLPSTSNPSFNAFCESFEQIKRISQGVKMESFLIETPMFTFSSSDDSGYWCKRDNNKNLYVTISASANLDFITPGLSNVFKFMNDGVIVKAKGVARCEVAR